MNEIADETVLVYIIDQLGVRTIDAWQRTKEKFADRPRDYEFVCSLREFARIFGVEADVLLSMHGYLRDEQGLWADVLSSGEAVVLPDDRSAIAFALWRYFHRAPLGRDLLDQCYSMGRSCREPSLLFSEREEMTEPPRYLISVPFERKPIAV
jgi:hypothetical protein